MFRKLMIAVGDKYVERHEKRVKRRRQLLKDRLTAEALTCRKCDSLAVPIFGVRSKYRCVKCGNQFAGRAHDVWEEVDRTFASTIGPGSNELEPESIYNDVIKEMSRP